MPDILGYARVSTEGQDLEGQRQRLREVGALKIFEDVISGKIFIRNYLKKISIRVTKIRASICK